MTTVEPHEQLAEVTVEGVRRFDENTALVLREAVGGRELPVFIGAPEAAAIAFALQGVPTLRPMTHDALKQMMDALGARPVRVQINQVPEASTFTADVTVALPGTERHLDWRVSDAVALAVRTDPRPTVLVPEALLDMPHPKLAAIHNIRCACGASVRFREEELTPGRPGSLMAGGTCPSCGRQFEVSVAPPPA